MFYPPYCCYDGVAKNPAGAFDAGLERVIAVDAAMGDKTIIPCTCRLSVPTPWRVTPR